MPKVDYKDLEEVTKFLDKISLRAMSIREVNLRINKSKELSKMIKDKYTEIKADYDRTD